MATKQEELLLQMMDHFNKAEDEKAWKLFFVFLAEINELQKEYSKNEDWKSRWMKFENGLEHLLVAMKNDDVIEMTELMEIELNPLLKDMIEGREQE